VALKAIKEKEAKVAVEPKVAPASTSRATRKITTKTFDRFIPNRAGMDMSESGHFMASTLAPTGEREYLSDTKVAYQTRVAEACGVCRELLMG
jgi:hypothetical protein